MKKFFALFFIFLTACSAPPTSSAEDQLATIVSSTLTAQPPTFTPIPTSTITNFQEGEEFFVEASSKGLNLRTYPVLLFPVSRILALGRELQVLGLAPGGEWAYVLDTTEGINGWVDITFITQFPPKEIPEMIPHDVQE